MNAAARALSQGGVFRGEYTNLTLSRPFGALMAAIVLVLLSAFSVVYLKNAERQLFNQYQQLKQENVSVQLEWSKLMLERSTWSAPSRVQRSARFTLAMYHPKPKLIVL